MVAKKGSVGNDIDEQDKLRPIVNEISHLSDVSGQERAHENDIVRRTKETYTAFLSLPHEFRDLRDAIVQKLAELKSHDVRCRFVTESKGEDLRVEVINELNQSDFIIADVSSSSKELAGPRPNVMWELGYS